MECRAYWKAKSASAPTSSKEAELRELLDNGAPVHALPSTSPHNRTLWSAADYHSFSQDVVTRLRDACVSGASIATPFTVLAEVVHVHLYSHATLDADTEYLSHQHWADISTDYHSDSNVVSTSETHANVETKLHTFAAKPLMLRKSENCHILLGASLCSRERRS